MKDLEKNLAKRGAGSLDMVLFDAVEIEDLDIPQKSYIKGDAKVLAIAAASIIAKVTRDRMMIKYAREYPWYAFEKKQRIRYESTLRRHKGKGNMSDTS